MGLDITDAALEAFLRGDPEPVVLVNLVRIRADGDEAYRRYGEAVAPLLARVGAEVLFSGRAAGALIGDERWDVATVVRYPSRLALAQLVHDPDFAAAAPLRHAALEAGLLYAFT